MPAAQRSDSEPTRRKITEALRAFHADGVRPTARELADKADVSHSTIRYHVEALAAQGIVAIEEVPAHHTRKEIVLLDGGSAS